MGSDVHPASGRSPSRRVLVLGDGDLAALAIVRSLGRSGLDVHLASFESSPITRRSRYVTHVHELGHPLENQTQFVDTLLRLLRTIEFDLVIPTSDKSLVPLFPQRELIGRETRFVSPDEKGFRVTNRKDETMELARECGLRIPETTLIASESDLARFDPARPYPLVLKPIVSVLPDRTTRNNVRFARTADELAQRVPDMLSACPVLVQEFCAGPGVGLSVLASEGVVTAAFQHERVHEPPEGGAGSYRRSAPLDHELLAGVKRFCEAIRWNGPAMFEFKQVADGGAPVLMEVNGRFWGSLALAIRAGVDFPRLLYESLVLGKTTQVFEYRVPCYMRHTIRDIPWWWANFRTPSHRADLLRVAPSQLIKEPWNFLSGREGLDLESLSDPGPAIVGWYHFAKSAVGAIFRRISRKRGAARVRQETQNLRRSPEQLARKVEEARSILFVCQGNINRSAIAEQALARLWDDNGVKPRIASAGLDRRRGRSSSSVSRSVAAEMEYDLSEHRSLPLTPEMLAEFDLVIPMETHQVLQISEMSPAANGKCVLLSAFDPQGGACDIRDPDGLPRAVFVEVYARILRCVQQLANCRKAATAIPEV